MIRRNLFIIIAALASPITLFAESELLLNGATYVAFSNKRPDLSLGFGYSYQPAKQFRISCNLNYSFRHQIASSDEDIPIAFAFFQDSLIMRVDEYVIDSYREKGYCFTLNLIPEFVINQIFFGIGMGLEYGNYTSHYTYKIKGQPDLAFHLPETSSRKDKNFTFMMLAGYDFSPFEIQVGLTWKRFQNIGLGLNIGWAFWKSNSHRSTILPEV